MAISDIPLRLPEAAKACGHLAHIDFQGGEINHGSVTLIGFLVSGGDPAKCFEAAEEFLHEMPPAISMEVTVCLRQITP